MQDLTATQFARKNNTTMNMTEALNKVLSAFAISIVDPQKSLSDALALARESLESGRALQTLERFIDVNGK